MKYLKIEDNKGFYQLEVDKWIEIDKISKEDLLTLLDKALDGDFEMDVFESEKIANKAHQIIYKHLHEKFADLTENANRFKDESEQMYKDAMQKYGEALRHEEVKAL
ncbi:MAG: hypothetical protein QM802_02560 [Agriterribacter sp.]